MTSWRQAHLEDRPVAISQLIAARPTDDSPEITEPVAASALELPVKQSPAIPAENGSPMRIPPVRISPVEATTTPSFAPDAPHGPATIPPSASESPIMDLANNGTGAPTRWPTQSLHISSTSAVANSALGAPDPPTEPESSALIALNDVSYYSLAKGAATGNIELMRLQPIFPESAVAPVASEPKATTPSPPGKPAAVSYTIYHYTVFLIVASVICLWLYCGKCPQHCWRFSRGK